MSSNPSPFLRLPCEIRLQIYRLVLPYSKYDLDTYKTPSIEYDMIHQSIDQDSTPPIEWISGTCPAILYVNCKIHHEATAILYSENAFVIFVTSADHYQRLFPSSPQ